jgi:uncharacterized delta-60 repeat protein
MMGLTLRNPGFLGSLGTLDGKLDVNFNTSSVFSSSSGEGRGVTGIAVQPNGKIIAVGNFNTINNFLYNHIVRLNVDGTIDSTFPSSASDASEFGDCGIDSMGKIIATTNGDSWNGSSISSGIISFFEDGSLDTTFTSGSGFNSTPRKVLIQSDNKVLVIGGFTTYRGTPVGFGLVRLNTDGSIDNTFSIGSGFNSYPDNFSLQNDGKIVVVGRNITDYNGSAANRICRLNTDGTLDTSFTSGFPNDPILDAPLYVKCLSNGIIILSGRLQFTTYDGVTAFGAAILQSDGRLFEGKTLGTQAQVIVEQSDGKTVWSSANAVRRFNSNFTEDEDFSSAFVNGEPRSMHVLPNQNILIGGYFTIYDDRPAVRMARIFSGLE